MSSRSKGGGGGEKENGLGTLAVAGIVLILIVAIWPYWRPYLAYYVVKIAVAESKALLWVSPILTQHYEAGLRALVENGTRMIATHRLATFQPMTNHDIATTWSYPSKALVPIVVALFALMVWHVKQTDVAARYRRRFRTVDDYIKYSARFYPHLLPIANLKLDEMDSFEGPWRIKQSYIDFAIEQQLLRDSLGELVRAKTDFKAAYYDETAARNAFVRQIGRPVSDDLSSLAPIERAMFGICAARALLERAESISAEKMMQRSWSMKPKKQGGYLFTVDLRPAIALAEKYWDHPTIRPLRRNHAFSHTLMARMTRVAQRSGEFCVSSIIWLRPTNPTLFWTMHQEGLREPNLEAAGPFVHFNAELRSGLPIREPVVEPAVIALRNSLVGESWLSSTAKVWKGAPVGYAAAETARKAA